SATTGAGTWAWKRDSARVGSSASPSRHDVAEKPTSSASSAKTHSTANAVSPTCSAAGAPNGEPGNAPVTKFRNTTQPSAAVEIARPRTTTPAASTRACD